MQYLSGLDVQQGMGEWQGVVHQVIGDDVLYAFVWVDHN